MKPPGGWELFGQGGTSRAEQSCGASTWSGAWRCGPAEGGPEGAGNGMTFAERGVRTTSGAAVGWRLEGCGWTKGW